MAEQRGGRPIASSMRPRAATKLSRAKSNISGARSCAGLRRKNRRYQLQRHQAAAAFVSERGKIILADFGRVWPHQRRLAESIKQVATSRCCRSHQCCSHGARTWNSFLEKTSNISAIAATW